jgi:putative ATP-binding cassette transporter
MNSARAINFKKICSLVTPYWRSEDKKMAWVLLIACMVTATALVGLQVWLNKWYNGFYDCLQKLDKSAFIIHIFTFCKLAIIFIIVNVISDYVQRVLWIRWRRYLTKDFVNEWINNDNYYRLTIDRSIDNPDQRISEDLNKFSTAILSLFLSIFGQILTLISFVGILWTLSGPFSFDLFGSKINIPGFLVWVVLLYCIISTIIAVIIGKPLVNLGFKQEWYEANFRYSMIKARVHSESIALYRGAESEQQYLTNNFADIWDNFKATTNRLVYLGSWQYIYANGSTVFPYIAAAPMFFAKVITLGTLMQIANAFGQVRSSLSMIVSSFDAIASLITISIRLNDLKERLQELSNQPKKINIIPGDHIKIEKLTILNPYNETIKENLSFEVKKGERVMVMGDSGLGKSTIIRAIAGIWPYGSGQIYLPSDKIMFISQKPYIPAGSFKDVICYPNNNISISDENLKQIIIDSGLEKFINNINDNNNWEYSLSLGEQQRVAFARMFVHKPSWIVMDEPTSSMDRKTEEKLFTNLCKNLPDCSFITVTHIDRIEKFHHRCIDLN